MNGKKKSKNSRKFGIISWNSITSPKPEYTVMLYPRLKYDQELGIFGAPVTKPTKNQKNRSPIKVFRFKKKTGSARIRIIDFCLYRQEHPL